ncbi:MAG: S8 family serine peptidase [Gracilibacteraceae bacterium]|jgi:hypothetical protein|nr:S8 family serine peptidase [Gracilibacteraceae bacterium]
MIKKKRKIISLLAALLLFSLAPPPASAPAAPGEYGSYAFTGGYSDQIVQSLTETLRFDRGDGRSARWNDAAATDELLVKLEPDSSLPDVEVIETAEKIFSLTGAEAAGADLNGEAAGDPAEASGPGDWYLLALRSGSQLERVAEELLAYPQVLCAEPNYTVNVDWNDISLPAPTEAEEGIIRAAAALPNNEPYQWKGADRLNYGYGVQAGLDKAAPFNDGAGVVVAVLDSGLNMHPDIVNSVYDPDKHRNFTGESDPYDVTDDNGHGTAMAGVIAGRNTGLAVGAKILPIKIGGASPYFQLSACLRGLDYIAELNADPANRIVDIANMSFSSPAYSRAMAEAVSKAWQREILLIASAGNEARPNEDTADAYGAVTYPAGFGNVVGVMASARTPDAAGNMLADFSNWDAAPGNDIEYEVMAPGTDIWSLEAAGSGYMAASGTSPAAAVVSAMAAVLKSNLANNGLDDDNSVLWDRVTGNTDLFSAYYSKGRTWRFRQVNLEKMLEPMPKSQAKIRILERTLQGRLVPNRVNPLSITVQSVRGHFTDVELHAAVSAAGAFDPSLTVNVRPAQVDHLRGAETIVWEIDLFVPENYNSSTVRLDLSLSGNLVDESGSFVEAINSAETRLTLNLEVLQLTVLRQAVLDAAYAAGASDFTLDPERNTWILAEEVTVPAGKTLTVPPGVRLLFDTKSGIINRGTVKTGVGGGPEDYAILQPFDLDGNGPGFVAITDAGGGRTDMDYTAVQRPLLSVNEIKHGFFTGDSPRLLDDEIEAEYNLPQRIAARAMSYTEIYDMWDAVVDAPADKCLFDRIYDVGFYDGRITNSLFLDAVEPIVAPSVIYNYGFGLEPERLRPQADGSFVYTTVNNRNLADFGGQNDFRRFLAAYLSLYGAAVGPDDIEYTVNPAADLYNVSSDTYGTFAYKNRLPAGAAALYPEIIAGNRFKTLAADLQKINPFHHNAIMTTVRFATERGATYRLNDIYHNLSNEAPNALASESMRYKLSDMATVPDSTLLYEEYPRLALASDCPPFIARVESADESGASVQGRSYMRKNVALYFNSNLDVSNPKAEVAVLNQPYYYPDGKTEQGAWRQVTGDTAAAWVAPLTLLRSTEPEYYNLFITAAGLNWAEDPWLTTAWNLRLQVFESKVPNLPPPPGFGNSGGGGGGGGGYAVPPGGFQAFPVVSNLPRIYGPDRVETSVAISHYGWKNSDTVILVSGNQENLIDALTASSLAGQEACPILYIVNGKMSMTVRDEIKWLGAKKIYVIGALPASVPNELNRDFPEADVIVLKGRTRMETTQLVNAEIKNPNGAFLIGYNAVPDALSAASYAAAHRFVFHLADPAGRVSGVPEDTGYILGGPTLVEGYRDFTRLGGSDRYATNAIICDTLTFKYDKVFTANGVSLVDALPGAALAAMTESPIFLTPGAANHNVSNRYVASDTEIVAFGGGG